MKRSDEFKSTLRKVAEVSNGGITVKVMRDADMGEYICQLTKDGKRNERADYYTGDKGDAIGTARLMCGLNPAKE